MKLKELVTELLVLLPKYHMCDVFTNYEGTLKVNRTRGVLIYKPTNPTEDLMLGGSESIPYNSIIISEV